MDEKLYKIKKGSEFEFYSTEASGTINKIVGETTQETETASLITVNEYSQVELDRDDTMRKVSIESTLPEITQDTREGYNKFNIDTISIGLIIATGYLDKTNSSFYSSDFIEIKALTQYLFSFTSNSNFFQIVVAFYDENKTFMQREEYSHHNVYSKIIETIENAKYIRISYSIRINGNDVIRDNIQFIEGTEAKPYEQYGASPSLDYPAEFENVTKEIDVNNCQENLLNVFDNIDKNLSSNGLKYIVTSDGMININGTSSSYSGAYSNGGYGSTNKVLKLLSNHKYRIYLEAKNTNGEDVAFYCGPTKNNSFNVYLTNDGIEYKDYTMSKDLIINQFSFIGAVKSGITRDNLILKAWIVDITNQTPQKNNFMPYKGYNKQIELPEGKFLGNFNGYKNYIKDSKLKSNLKIITLDGTEKYTIQSTETNTIRFKLDLSLDTNVVLDNTNLNYLCNYLKAYKYNESTEDKEGIFIGATTSSIEIYMRVPLNEIASIDDFKEFLSSKAITEEPFKILLQCGEEETSLEDINLPLYNGTNNIFAENGIISFYPYADMPSLERPSPIESISGEYNIDIHGENFLQDQYNTTNLAKYNWCFYIKANLKPDTTYTISLIGAIDNIYYVSEQLAVGGDWSFTITMTGERQSITFTTKSDISGAWNTSLQMYNIFKNAKAQPHEHIFKDVMLVEESVAKDYVPYVSSTTTIELPEGVELNKINREDYVKQDGTITVNNKRITFDGTENWSFNTEVNRFDIYNLPISILDVPQTERKQLCTHFKTYNPYANSQGSFSVGNSYIRIYNDNNMTLEEWKTYLAQQNEAGTPVEIVYTSGEPTKSVLPTTEVTKMQLFPVIIGENHLVAPSEMVLLYYDEREEEENIQPITITNEGKLLPFNLLVDYNKTDLPLIAEAIEASQTITGADGDLVLDTTYGSRLFEIDAVTDDFLTPEQKEAKREEIREFLNSIKKVNTKLIIEPQNRTYEVKYAGLAEDTNLPKCVEFLIPLKSASAYAISNTTYTLEGEGEIESETKAPAGFVCTISGPSNYPELALNGYLMAYENVILEGEKLIIDTKKSTVTKISTTGVKTNAMVYYNHQFPRIQEGLNLFTIISGIDEDKLKIEWNDLLL